MLDGQCHFSSPSVLDGTKALGCKTGEAETHGWQQMSGVAAIHPPAGARRIYKRETSVWRWASSPSLYLVTSLSLSPPEAADDGDIKEYDTPASLTSPPVAGHSRQTAAARTLLPTPQRPRPAPSRSHISPPFMNLLLKKEHFSPRVCLLRICVLHCHILE